MIKAMKWGEHGIALSDKIEKGVWVNLINPSKGEIEEISMKCKIPIEFITDPLDLDERARIENEEGIFLIVLRIPKQDKKGIIPYTTIPVGIILCKDIIVTVCIIDISDVLDLKKIKGIDAENRSGFILRIFLKTALLYLKYLKDINKKTSDVEVELQKALRNEELIKLLNIEKSLVYFTTSLRANELMMERLLKTEILTFSEDDKDMLEDVIIENKQAIEMSNIYSNILSGMMDAFASVISNNLNGVMKKLTFITILLMIPTLISSAYGMNVTLPIQHNPYTFYILAGISCGLSVMSVLIFIKNKWF